MGFLVPAFLAGLAAIAIPVLLHLRHRDRDTPHRFPSLMFIDRLPIRTAQRRRITDWPLLLLRALAIALLVLAFSRPLWSRPRVVASASQPRTVIVLLDRSMSMSHLGVWPAAVDSLRRVISSLAPTDRVAVILFDDEAEVAQPFTSDRALALAAVVKARPGAGGTRYAAALRAARQLAADARTGTAPVEVVLASDLQRVGTAGTAGLEMPSSFRVRAIQLATSARTNASVAVTEARTRTEGGREKLVVSGRVTSRGLGAARQMTVMLRLNGRPSGTRVISVAGAGDTRVTFEPVALPAGLVRGQITIDSDSLAGDDTAHFALTSDAAVRVLLVAPDDAERDETLYIERALAIGQAPSVRVERVRPQSVDAGMLKGAALVMLWDVPAPAGRAGSALAAWVGSGGGVVHVAGRRLGRRAAASVIFPANVTGMADRSDDRGGSLGDVRLDHALLAPFRDAPAALVAPRFLRHARLEPANGGEVVARFDDGSAAVIVRRERSGRVVTVATPLDARAGDFPLQPAYLPFVRRLVMFTSGRDATALARETGDNWLLPASIEEPVVATPSGSIVRPTRVEKDLRGATVPLRESGIYLLHDGAVSGAPANQLAVNAPAGESDLSPITSADLLAGVRTSAQASTTAASADTPIDVERRQGFWRVLIAVLGVLLLLEMLMASRGWRAEANPLTVRSTSGEGS